MLVDWGSRLLDATDVQPKTLPNQHTTTTTHHQTLKMCADLTQQPMHLLKPGEVCLRRGGGACAVVAT